MTFARRSLAIAALGAVVLAACGGGDDDATAPPVTEAPGAAPGDRPAGTDAPGPVVTLAPPRNTIPADVPDAYLPAIGPIDVTGTWLPPFDPAVGIDGDPARGMLAPTLLGVDFHGTPVRLDAAADGPTMAVFVAHWCPHCNAEVPRIVELARRGQVPAGVDVVAVSTAPDPQRPNFPPGDWLEDADWPYPVIADGVDMSINGFAAASAFGLSGFPFVVLIDGDGKVAARWSGETEGSEMVDRINQYLGA